MKDGRIVKTRGECGSWQRGSKITLQRTCLHSVRSKAAEVCCPQTQGCRQELEGAVGRYHIYVYDGINGLLENNKRWYMITDSRLSTHQRLCVCARASPSSIAWPDVWLIIEMVKIWAQGLAWKIIILIYISWVFVIGNLVFLRWGVCAIALAVAVLRY